MSPYHSEPRPRTWTSTPDPDEGDVLAAVADVAVPEYPETAVRQRKPGVRGAFDEPFARTWWGRHFGAEQPRQTAGRDVESHESHNGLAAHDPGQVHGHLGDAGAFEHPSSRVRVGTRARAAPVPA
ncbi:hypothetical protein AB0F91_19855 [Amycolatopsis sp. NPDC023774]|uniref:hypothetical protein n=1 Tax=Amycolatopsis sp. NPDC023774 TaxID=3155015 RepID=UPI003408161E